MMPDLLVYLLKVNAALLLFVGVYYGLLRQLTFHTLNRWYLLGAIVFAALYPLVDVAALWPRPAVLSGDLIVWQSNWISQSAPTTRPVDYYSWLMGLYWFGVALLGARLLVQGLSLRRLHQRSVPANGLPFRPITESVKPFSFWQTIYVNPTQHRPAELPAILQHEQVHVQQWHTLDVLLGQLQRVFCWPNPAAWLLLRALQENLEFIADQAVLQTGRVDSKQYQYSLVQLSTLAQGPALVTPFNFHPLKTRIKMINSQKTSAVHAARYLLVAPLVALLLLGSCSKTEQEQPVQPAATGVQNIVENALYFVDGEKSTKEAVEVLQQDASAIATMNVLKGKSATEQFGEAAAAGAIIITTKANQNSPAVAAFNKQHSPTINQADALILIDGKEATARTLEQLPKSRIKEMSVLKGAAAEAQYGAKAHNGVIVVTTGAEGAGGLNQLHERNGTINITK
ncbi:M56 family metallopeptidase [Hymenobacter sp.]|jgi:TonB-dependent SusC/RagA subfamily outer membrane receptor|uniref:M56 family metallopeptidase n=1 Tax=Hymenobacter sp. TaxID=1898978 RepID=UPI002ED9FEC9